jgi:hypothetical protein
VSRTRQRLLVVALGVVCAGTGLHADNSLKAFTRSWEGRRVVVKRTMYTVVYDERNRLGIWRRNRMDGLTVTTPSGMYYQFDGRLAEADLTGHDPGQLLEQVVLQYRRDMHTEIGLVVQVKPMLLKRYQPGVELVVKGVQTDRDRVRVVFAREDTEQEREMATTLTVKWPVPLSSDFSERALIDDLIHQFVEFAPLDQRSSR